MSTGFQPMPYDDAFFPSFPTAAPAQVTALKSQHIRIQPVGTSQPMLANSSPQQASDWSFTALDKTVQPLLAAGDASPQLQIAQAPVFLNNSSGQFIVNSANLATFASYAANLVRYYNTGGFTWGGQHFQSASSTHITQWAIFNEPNLNGISAAQYVQIYNALVPRHARRRPHAALLHARAFRRLPRPGDRLHAHAGAARGRRRTGRPGRRAHHALLLQLQPDRYRHSRLRHGSRSSSPTSLICAVS